MFQTTKIKFTLTKKIGKKQVFDYMLYKKLLTIKMNKINKFIK